MRNDLITVGNDELGAPSGREHISPMHAGMLSVLWPPDIFIAACLDWRCSFEAGWVVAAVGLARVIVCGDRRQQATTAVWGDRGASAGSQGTRLPGSLTP